MVQAQSLTATLVYTYNADGLRVAQSQSVASVESVDTFTWDWATGVPELLSDGDSLYLIGYDTLGWQNGDDWTFVLPDALGSVRQETDAAGAVTAAREWSPYGEELGGAQAGLGYIGEWFDANVGLTYLRARWYDGQIGLFSVVDPMPGLATEPLSLNPYLYVLANPINAIDPSGLYHKDLHYTFTREWAYLSARSHGFDFTGAAILSGLIADGDWIVDADLVTLASWPACPECHFQDLPATYDHVREAINSKNPYLFGATLHQFQDFYSHWREGYNTDGHAKHTLRAGVVGSSQNRTPHGGKSDRPENRLDEFFAAYPREEIQAKILNRNPGMTLALLTDDDLIDLYLRRELGQMPDDDLRDSFGLDPDAYIENSRRENFLKQRTIALIDEFMQSLLLDPCTIEWKKPAVSEIKQLLTE